MEWVYLFIAVIAEVIATTALKATESFTKPLALARCYRGLWHRVLSADAYLGQDPARRRLRRLVGLRHRPRDSCSRDPLWTNLRCTGARWDHIDLLRRCFHQPVLQERAALEPFPPDLNRLRRPNTRRPAGAVRRAMSSHRSRTATNRSSEGGQPVGTGAFAPWRRRAARPWNNHAFRRPPGHNAKSPRRSDSNQVERALEFYSPELIRSAVQDRSAPV